MGNFRPRKLIDSRIANNKLNYLPFGWFFGGIAGVIILISNWKTILWRIGQNRESASELLLLEMGFRVKLAPPLMFCARILHDTKIKWQKCSHCTWVTGLVAVGSSRSISILFGNSKCNRKSTWMKSQWSPPIDKWKISRYFLFFSLSFRRV